METILLEILDKLKEVPSIDDDLLTKIIRKHNRNLDNSQHFSKKKMLPYYLKVRETDPKRWESWGVDPATEKRLMATLQVKPRRTASGVATITVITKPWRCSSDCLYCPCDLRMPKSYLSDEPACQRAERNYFDPYLQVTSRLRALMQMGHVTDKIELIVLGGSWSDYPKSYQIWFVSELFRALNDAGAAEENAKARRAFYKRMGLSNREDELARFVSDAQNKVDRGKLTYNQAVTALTEEGSVWSNIASVQVSDLDELTRQQQINERSGHRVVGLVIETRPDAITSENLTLFRQLGATKVQMGIQSLDQTILAMNKRDIDLPTIENAFSLLRIFGFKIHAHFMLNLYGSNPTNDKREYERFVTEAAFMPDEVKLYPCVLVQGTRLSDRFAEGTWQPYTEDELIDILVHDTLVTPPFMRISRMIRDISSHDIVAGNRKANLRQMVEQRIGQGSASVSEIRYREITSDEVDPSTLKLQTFSYKTSNTTEHFLEWVTPENRIAGFLRLSLPAESYVRTHQGEIPVGSGEAMIREVHVYGRVAKLLGEGQNAQHIGLGKQLIETACTLARSNEYKRINVISSVGTREYYRTLGFSDYGLYQQKDLDGNISL